MSELSVRIALQAVAVLACLTGVLLHGTWPIQAQGSMLAMSQAQRAQFEKRLNLSAEQTPKVAAIIQRMVREGVAVFRKHGVIGAPGKRPGLFQLVALKKDMDGVRGWGRAALSKILSPVQMREYEQIAAQRQAAIRAKLLK